MLLNLLLNAFDADRPRREGDDPRSSPPDRLRRGSRLPTADPGIPQAVRDRLFEPFVSTKESGTGLGLTICRRIVEDHGGRSRPLDSPTGGSIFTTSCRWPGSRQAGSNDADAL